jgi:anti-sigma B factor antagonist
MKEPLAPAELSISIRELTGCMVVSPIGEFDIATATELRTHLCRVLNRWQRPVVVDLGGVTFMDSSGLGALLAGYRRATQLGCEFVLAAPAPQVAKVLEMTAMGHVLPIYDSAREACVACIRSHRTNAAGEGPGWLRPAARVDNYVGPPSRAT